MRQQLDSIHEISQRSRVDLEYVETRGTEVTAIRDRVDELLQLIESAEERFQPTHSAVPDSDPAGQTAALMSAIEDVRARVEALTAGRAATEGAAQTTGRLADLVREAEATLKSLQSERELAERLQKGVRQARTKTA